MQCCPLVAATQVDNPSGLALESDSASNKQLDDKKETGCTLVLSPNTRQALEVYVLRQVPFVAGQPPDKAPRRKWDARVVHSRKGTKHAIVLAQASQDILFFGRRAGATNTTCQQHTNSFPWVPRLIHVSLAGRYYPPVQSILQACTQRNASSYLRRC